MKQITYFMLLAFLSCNGQNNILNQLHEIKHNTKDTLSTNKIDSMLMDTSYNILKLNHNQKIKYLKGSYPDRYSSSTLNAFFITFINKEKYYSIFIKAIIGDSRHEIIIVNVDEELRFIDSKILHGGHHLQPEELENGNVKWYIDNFSFIVDDRILYHDIELYSEGFHENAKEWTEKKVNNYKINDIGKIQSVQ